MDNYTSYSKRIAELPQLNLALLNSRHMVLSCQKFPFLFDFFHFSHFHFLFRFLHHLSSKDRLAVVGINGGMIGPNEVLKYNWDQINVLKPKKNSFKQALIPDTRGSRQIGQVVGSAGTRTLHWGQINRSLSSRIGKPIRISVAWRLRLSKSKNCFKISKKWAR